MSQTTDHIFEFGPFRLETSERRLLRDGCPIPLTPKTFEALLALVQSSGRVVTKDDLMKRVWPDAVVEESNLSRIVWTLRKALGDGNGQPAYIETVPKLGYRFVAQVADLVDASPAVLIQRRVKSGVVEEGTTDQLPPKVTTLSRAFIILVVLVILCIGLASVGLVRILGEPARPATSQRGIRFLTDGSHDDNGATWTNNGRLYFSRFITRQRSETWTMDADGTNQRRANTEIKTLLTGRWAPDGKKVIFTKEADSPSVIYLANADGTHEIVLPFPGGNLDWSPDGSQVVYEERVSSTKSQIGLYTLNTQKVTTLTPAGASDADPSFSPDGTRIAFTSWRDGTDNAEIYVMQTDGSNVRRVTNNSAFDHYPVFSPDGTQLAFQSNREDEHFEIYLQNLDDTTPPVRLSRSSNWTGFAPKCWSADGTEMLVYVNQNGRDQVAAIDVDPYPARVLLGAAAADLDSPRLSKNGRQLLHEARLADRSIELRVTDRGTDQTKTLFRTEPGNPINYRLRPAWSPDNTLIAFSARIGGNSEIFSIKPDGTGLLNLTENPLRDSGPAFSADGREVFFDRDAFGRGQLYRMDANGRNQRRVTAADSYETQVAASPDATHLAFAGDRESRGYDIFLLDLNRPSEGRLLVSRRSHDGTPAFSPDGKRLAFVAMSDGNPEIYVINVDGTGLFRVTRNKQDDLEPQFSNDGRQILFSSNRSGKFALYEVNLP